jgi:pilus assembly protein TadC
MKRFYLFIFIGIAAIAAIVVILMNFNPSADTWSSLAGGAAIGFLVVGAPSIISYLKKKRQNGAK